MRILCFGDSVVESGTDTRGWCTLLQARLDRRCPGAHRVIVAGFGGRHSGELLDRMGEHVLPLINIAAAAHAAAVPAGSLLAADGVHLSDAGHAFYATIIGDAVERLLAQS